MAKKTKKRGGGEKEETEQGLHPDTKAGILAVVFSGLALVLVLSGFFYTFAGQQDQADHSDS